MRIGIVKEAREDERRVAAAPPTVGRLVKAGWEVVVEQGAGVAANFADRLYEEVGARVVDPETAWTSDLVVKVRPPELSPTVDEIARLKPGATLISFVFPGHNGHLLHALAARGVSALAVDGIPRISRAQKVDALSSMANIAGYRAVVEAANRFGRFFTGQFTAAGKVPPAKVLVIGAGVAGLAAVAAAKGLGAIVRAFDVRPSVADQVKSLGGEFLTVDVEESGEGGGGYAKQMSPAFLAAEEALFLAQAADVDIVITTALIPGKAAPRLWNAAMVAAMKPGSVIVDLAAEQGGNCELTEPGKEVVHHGVTIIGYTDLASRMAHVASDLYGSNIAHLLDELGGADGFALDLENEIVRGALVVHEGEIRWPPPPPRKVEPQVEASREGSLPQPAAPAVVPAATAVVVPVAAPKPGATLGVVLAVAVAAGALGLRYGSPDGPVDAEVPALLQHVTVFVLSVFVGWQVVWNVTPALHTPLMSVTNAISGIIVVGGLLAATSGTLDLASGLGLAATFFATLNLAGGFLVTRRMLAMFRR